MSRAHERSERGPFTADQIREGDRYELHRGHPIYRAPTGARGSRARLVGGEVLETDPLVEEAGIDVGYSPEPGALRAPDVAVGNVPDRPGWVKGAPLLALEYADVGQDENDLATKIRDLLAAGTRLVWVVRLTGPRRVEVHEPGAPMRIVSEGALTASGILKNDVPIAALFDREAAHQAVLRNLLQRQGYAGVEGVREEGRLLEARAALRRVFARRGLTLPSDLDRRIDECHELSRLQAWLDAAITAESAEQAMR